MNHERIKALREKRKMTQAQAAVAAGMNDPRHWSNIERGYQQGKSISIELLERIAKALGVKASDLLK